MSTSSNSWTLNVPSSTESTSMVKFAMASRDHGDIQGESVFLPDGRRPALSGDYQDGGRYRSVVKIQARFEDKDKKAVWMMGSGWLVHPKILVTAGHVVYDHGHRLGRVMELRCYIGYCGRASIKDPSVQMRFGNQVVTTAEWVASNSDRTKDVAFIQVSEAFAGDLQLFKPTNTPMTDNGAYIGVVGYPGDKSLPDEERGVDEFGAQMYEQFETTEYDLEKSPRHMLEYKISTFGGQSGAPVIRRGKSIDVIGTHCYGGGGDEQNSGNAIGPPYGNIYETFLMMLGPGTVPPPRNRVPSTKPNGTEGGSIPRPEIPGAVSNGDSDTEGIWEILGVISKAGAAIVPIAGSIIGGPIGGALGTAAGAILSSVAGAEGLMDAGRGPESITQDKLAPGAAERAVLAEAALQTVISLADSPETDQVLEHLEKTYQQFSPHVDAIAARLSPQLTECAMSIAVSGMNRTTGLNESATESSGMRRRLVRVVDGEIRSAAGKDFVEGLLKDTIPAAGEEGWFDGLGGLLSRAVKYAAPIVSQAAKDAITTFGPKLVDKLLPSSGTESMTASTGTLNKDASRLIFKRALLADASLQALMSLDKAQLARLRMQKEAGAVAGVGEQQEGAVFDFIKAAVQKLAPVAADVAKQAVVKLGPALIDIAKDKITGGSPVTRPDRPSGNASSRFSRLHGGQPRDTAVSGFQTIGDAGSGSEAMVDGREKGVVEPGGGPAPFDSNKDLPVIMPGGP
ncbi:hypothetical protein F4778DRAFT_787417 [Xylariomycetidae sp. FL2044]|nr:hypothetical protein F4778DRAFT_787417 [Xylariomycetidae sp. FL2044]